MTEQLWYPLWDAGFVTGHGARTVKESIALADDDLDALDGAARRARHRGRRPSSRVELRAQGPRARGAAGGPRAARRSPTRPITGACDPGAIAEMLEPDLKEGAGGLRDLQSFDWAGWALGRAGRLRDARRAAAS